MRKDDIIGQKLFETCKLSEFYLDLVVNAKSDDESPLLLARAYKQKLYEIVERYDRLLDANRQRQQLSLTLDTSNNPQQQQQQQNKKPQLVTRKPPTTPLQTPTTRTSTPNKLNFGSQLQLNYSNQASYPTTPSTPSQPLKSSFSTYSISQSGKNNNNNNRPSPNTPSRHSLYSLNKPNPTKSPFFNPHIYDDDYDDDEYELNDDAFFDSSKTKLTYENLTRKLNEDESSEEQRVLDKSCSNLSKDSGVFGDSYHSEYSNNCLIELNNNKNNETKSKEENYLENLLTPSSSLSNTERDEYDDEEDEDVDEHKNEDEIELDDELESKNKESKTQFIWGTVSRLVENSFNNLSKKNQANKQKAIEQPPPLPLPQPHQTKSNNFKTYTKPTNFKNSIKTDSVNVFKNFNNLQLNNNNEMMSLLMNNNENRKQELTSKMHLNPTTTHLTNETLNPNNNTANPMLNSTVFKNSSFIFNYNSLMNVSMLDSIQVTNSNLEYDNMNSSILMFN